ncbi:MAG: potassium/proton antiporter [Chthonomonadaceae bacterium]|nr:potassium/proton antiporter [Chthonomonadaceae bacterium]
MCHLLQMAAVHNTDFERGMLIVAGLLALSVLASKVSARVGIPATLVFLAVGMLAGSDGPGGIWFDNVATAQHLGIVALAFILFSCGMGTHLNLVKKLILPAISLATVGVVVTAVLIGFAAHYWLNFTLYEGMLLGAIIAPTDAAAVFGTVRTQGIRLPEGVETLVEAESGINDPAAVFLTNGFVGALSTNSKIDASLGLSFLTQMGLGCAVGILLGWVGVKFMKKVRLEVESLYSVVTVCLVLASMAATTLIGGSGFLAAYLTGLLFGNGDFQMRKSMAKFVDNVAWLLQIAMFLVLGLLVFPSNLPNIAVGGLLIVTLLTFVARPLGVIVALTPFRVTWREQALVCWCGLRGAVPIVLATFPLMAGLERAHEIFDVVFFVVLVSSLLQGMTIKQLNARLFPAAPGR